MLVLDMKSHQLPHTDVSMLNGTMLYDLYTSPSAAKTTLGTPSTSCAVNTCTLHTLTGSAPTSYEVRATVAG